MSEFKKFANSFQTVARLELESISCLLKILNNPESGLSFIHVAGTNGKGSVCSFLQNIFTCAGFKTGKYISPNLIDVCERISIDGENINENELNSLLEEVEKASLEVKNTIGDFPTQFEIWTAAAFLYFKKNNVDIVILETGLGGERDATNVVKNTKASVITKISFDHTSYLGDTIEEIAKAKAGIIKENDKGITVSDIQVKEVEDVLIKTAKDKYNKFIVIDKPENIISKGNYEIFDYKDIKGIKCGLLGAHQTENASLAIETSLALGIDISYIKQGIQIAKNPARFEIVGENPIIVFDGAHNPDGIMVFAESIKRHFSGKKMNFIMGVMADKDLSGIIEKLKEYEFFKNGSFYTVMVKDNPRAMTSEKLSGLLKDNGFSSTSCECIDDALDNASKDTDAVFIFGSLYLYKDYKYRNKI